jgi:hypothetical protein
MYEEKVLSLKSGDITYTVDDTMAESVLTSVTGAYLDGRLLYGSEVIHPEQPFIELLKQYESTYPGITLNGLFLATSLTLGGSTRNLYSRLANPELFEKNIWLFMPSEVVSKSEDICIRALSKYVKPNGLPTKSIIKWHHNCQEIVTNYDGNIKILFEKCGDDAVQILEKLMGGRERLHPKKHFKRFGTKLSTLFLLWLDQYNLCQLNNIDNIGIPIDRHVRRFILKTGIFSLKNDIQVHNFSYDLALPMLKKVVRALVDKGFRPWQIMNAIWGLSTNECSMSLHNQCSIRDECLKVTPVERATKVLAYP